MHKWVWVLFGLLSFYPADAQNKGYIILDKSKFATGDEPGWKKAELHDANWANIRTGEVWQTQGYADYHGYAWYRIHVTIPSSLKNKSGWKDSLRIFLAHINDVDETYLNGKKIGQTGSFPGDAGGYESKWPAPRTYCVSIQDASIKWDQENIIAIRVFDGGGTGGIFMGTPYIDVLEKTDGIAVDESKSQITYKKGKRAEKSFEIKNTFNTRVEGILHYSVYNRATNKRIDQKKTTVGIPPFSSRKYTLDLPHEMGIEIDIDFTETRSGIKKSFHHILPYLLTPAVSDKPKINSPAVFGVRPGSPFLFQVAATGKGVITYSATNLPQGLHIDQKTGIITGRIVSAGDYNSVLVAENKWGNAEKPFTIRAGELLSLTPPMGWNSWNCWGTNVSDEKVRTAAQALVSKGLKGHGWSYINIDDGWEAGTRNKDSVLSPNEKFPDMKKLGDYLHDNGLRFGIYSSPGTKTCGGFTGSYQNEWTDAQTYASWGIDYLKYDLCSYSDLLPSQNSTLEQHQAPYKIMRDALNKQPRDILYSICQYGLQDVWKWGREMNGNLWRTTEDIEDTWSSLFEIGFSQSRLATYSNPGGWNDPDMLTLGMVGWGENLHPTRLTPYEQYTQMSLWSLLSAPLLLGCDLSRLDTFTINLLTNDEVIAVDQDVLGIQATRVINKDSVQVWIKEMADKTKTIGIFNVSAKFQEITIQWSDLNLSGNIRVRDLWKQEDLGLKKDFFKITIPPHGVSLNRVENFKTIQ